MTDLHILNILAFVVSAVLTGVFMPTVIRLAFRYNRLDRPESRKIHRTSIPRLGGVAFIPIAVFSAILIVAFSLRLYPELELLRPAVQPATVAFCGVAVGLIYAMGFIDDIFGLRYVIKFGVQFLAAVMVLLAGLQLDNLGGIAGFGQIPGIAAILLTVFLVIGIINAFNLIDGLDGLCASLAAIALVLYGSAFLLAGDGLLSLICFSVIGALAAFFCFNMYGNASRHTKIFMGDSGSLSLGLIISIAALALVCTRNEVMPEIKTRLVYVISPLLIPVLDSVRVFCWRIYHRKNPFEADKNHIHHRLLAAGLSQSMCLAVLCVLSAFFCIFNGFMATSLDINVLLIIDIIIWVAFSLILGRLACSGPYSETKTAKTSDITDKSAGKF